MFARNSSIFRILMILIIMLSLLTLKEVEGKKKVGDDCAKIECEEPKESASGDCTIVPESDTSVPRPTGPSAECCPLWKCEKGEGKFYTVHGVKPNSAGKGGKETVQYKKGKKGSSASSSATEDHDALAKVGETADIDDALAQIQAAIGLG